jgi:TetR/AcrR family transcriptional regulator
MPRPRKPGRPERNAPDQRARLLDAALQTFVSDGIAASTLRAVALRAGATPALVHYYFGDKEQLIDAVIDERLLPVLGTLRGSAADGMATARHTIRRFVETAFELFERHPWLATLWIREVLSEGGALRERLMPRLAPMIPLKLAQRFAAAQKAGAMNPSLDPRLLVVSLIGLTLFASAAAPVWRGVFGAADVDRAALVAHTIALLERGLELTDED